MTSPLSTIQLNAFQDRLKTRLQALLDEIRQELLKSDEEHFSDLAGRVHDLEDESVADLLVDLNLASIDRHVQEVRDIEGALIRIETGEYGVCIDCTGISTRSALMPIQRQSVALLASSATSKRTQAAAIPGCK